jgi:hypothetical protein
MAKYKVGIEYPLHLIDDGIVSIISLDIDFQEFPACASNTYPWLDDVIVLTMISLCNSIRTSYREGVQSRTGPYI